MNRKPRVARLKMLLKLDPVNTKRLNRERESYCLLKNNTFAGVGRNSFFRFKTLPILATVNESCC